MSSSLIAKASSQNKALPAKFFYLNKMAGGRDEGKLKVSAIKLKITTIVALEIRTEMKYKTPVKFCKLCIVKEIRNLG